MAQLVSKQFHAALTYFLTEEGWGAQARLAQEQKIDRGYLNAIIKGRKNGSDKIREKIAGHFGVTFEEMLSLGRRVLDGEDGDDCGDPVDASMIVSDDKQGKPVDLESRQQGQEVSDDLLEIITTTVKNIGSNPIYGDFLSNLNRLLLVSSEMAAVKKENDVLREDKQKLQSQISEVDAVKKENVILKEDKQKQQDQINELLERLASVEKTLAGGDNYSRKTA